MKRTLAIFIALLLFAHRSLAQSAAEIEMADSWRANGKINVVIAVLAVIFLGLFIYLIGIDRKLRRMEERKD